MARPPREPDSLTGTSCRRNSALVQAGLPPRRSGRARPHPLLNVEVDEVVRSGTVLLPARASRIDRRGSTKRRKRRQRMKPSGSSRRSACDALAEIRRRVRFWKLIARIWRGGRHFPVWSRSPARCARRTDACGTGAGDDEAVQVARTTSRAAGSRAATPTGFQESGGTSFLTGASSPVHLSSVRTPSPDEPLQPARGVLPQRLRRDLVQHQDVGRGLSPAKEEVLRARTEH